MYGALIVSLGAVALLFTAGETSAKSGTTHRASVHSISHPSVAQLQRHRRRNNANAFWPADSGYYGGLPNGEPTIDGTPTASGDVHFTQTYDVPWDWAHRYPPSVTPSDRPYVPSCTAEAVTVPGRDGSEQTVNVTRCY
jgi:hypothetical protein